MPRTKLVFFREKDGAAPLLDWLDSLPKKARVKCIARLERLALLGHELRRPEADFLRDGIYELRVGLQGINYRMLYFFYGRTVAVVSHGLVKSRVVPAKEIELAIERKKQFERAPAEHTFEQEFGHGKK
jgi:phage-related protein